MARGRSGDSRAVHEAVAALHAFAGNIPSVEAGAEFGTTQAEAMKTVAGADLAEVPQGARLDIIHSLAELGYPGRDDHAAAYKALAISLDIDVKPDDLLDELRAVADGTMKIDRTQTAQKLPDTHSIAFVGEDLCSVREVMVGGKPARWVFSEFETNAPFDDVAEWVDPRHWHDRAGMMFKSMAPEKPDGIAPLPGPGERWHGDFKEVVNFGEKELTTGLHCDFAKADPSASHQYALVTYRWNWSHNDQITVDRGFLMVNDLGKNRQVKVLKVVAFTDPALNEFADTVCPWWTDFIRAAARGGDKHGQAAPTSRPGTSYFGPNMRELVGIYRKGVQDYVTFAGQLAKGMSSPRTYGPRELFRDSTGYWAELAKDWARAWTAGNDIIAGMGGSPAGLDAFGGPRGRDGSESEGTTIPLPDIDVNTEVECGDLTLLGAHQAVIPASRTQTELRRLSDGSLGLHLEAATPGVEIGMYLGELVYGPNRKTRPVQLYVSQAVDVVT